MEQRTLEVLTFWQGDLLDVTRTLGGPLGRRTEGSVEILVRPAETAIAPVGAGAVDWTFWRVLAITSILYAFMVVMFELTPKTTLEYVLAGETLGSMKLPSGPGIAGPLRPAAYHPHLAGTPDAPLGTKKRRGPLIPSPPGSRTYQAPAILREDVPVLGLLGSMKGTEISGVFATLEGGSALRGDAMDLVGSGGWGVASVRDSGTGGLGTSGMGVAGGVLGRVRTDRGIGGLGSGGGIGTIGRSVGRLRGERKLTRVVRCPEIVDYVRRLMPEHGPDRPSRLLLDRSCRSAPDPKSMTCIGRAKDEGADRAALLRRCGDQLPAVFIEALRPAAPRPSVPDTEQ